MMLAAIDSPAMLSSEPMVPSKVQEIHAQEKPVTIEDLSLLSQELSELDVPKSVIHQESDHTPPRNIQLQRQWSRQQPEYASYSHQQASGFSRQSTSAYPHHPPRMVPHAQRERRWSFPITMQHEPPPRQPPPESVSIPRIIPNGEQIAKHPYPEYHHHYQDAATRMMATNLPSIPMSFDSLHSPNSSPAIGLLPRALGMEHHVKEHFPIAIDPKDHGSTTYPTILPKLDVAPGARLGNSLFDPLAMPLPLSSSAEVSSIFSLDLIHEDLWNLFHQNHNEMIITRFGRCLFPSLKFKLSVGPRYRQIVSPTTGNSMLHQGNNIGGGSLDEPLMAFGLQLVKTSAEKLKFRQGSWIPNRRHGAQLPYGNNGRFPADVSSPSTYIKPGGATTSISSSMSQMVYWHPSGVQSLSFWAKYGLSFLDAKLTNGKKSSSPSSASSSSSSSTKISAMEKKELKAPFIAPGGEATLVNCLSGVLFQLESFYEYTPKVVCRIYSMGESGSRIRSGIPTTVPMPGSSPTACPPLSAEFLFSKCSFIAVTHYQNSAINMLKKQYNPHAKGFVPDVPSISMHHFSEDGTKNENGDSEQQHYSDNSDSSEPEELMMPMMPHHGAGESFSYTPLRPAYPARFSSPSTFLPPPPLANLQPFQAPMYYNAIPSPMAVSSLSADALSDSQLNALRQRQHAYSLPSDSLQAPENGLPNSASISLQSTILGGGNGGGGAKLKSITETTYPMRKNHHPYHPHHQQSGSGRFFSTSAADSIELDDSEATALLASWYTQKQQAK